jgi:iron complex transport system substrate-binding protein
MTTGDSALLQRRRAKGASADSSLDRSAAAARPPRGSGGVRSGRSVVLVLVACLAVGCDRAARPSSSAPATSAPADDAAALRMHDYVAQPELDPAERSPTALRIVSTAPNVTEICCALGLRSNLVGRTRFCDYPPEVRDVASIGALVDLNVETVLGLQPDLVLVSGESRIVRDRLAPLDLRIEALPDTSLEDIFAAIRRAGDITSRPRTAALLCERISADLATIADHFAHRPKRRVLLLIEPMKDPPQPPWIAGPGSYHDALLRRLGHANVAETAGPAFGPLPLEFILDADPDIIIELDPAGTHRRGGEADALRIWSAIGPLRVVRQRCIRVIGGPEHAIPGPRIAQTFLALARAAAANCGE